MNSPNPPIPLKLPFAVTLFLLLFLLVTPVYGQYGKNAAHDRILGKLRTYVEKNGPEKVYLQTDKDFYINGETIWFKAYLVNGIWHTSSIKSRVIYVELISPNDSIIAQKRLFIENLGAAGDIKIDEKALQGNYTLRAYTRYMLNAENPLPYEKQIPILVQDAKEESVKEKPSELKDLEMNRTITGQLKPRFFPEGGHLVAGLPNILAYEIKDTEGNYVATQGEIVDENGTWVAFFSSFDFGLGTLHFMPKAGKKYYATFQNAGPEERFPLPSVLEKGHVLNVMNKGDHLIINVSTTIENGLDQALLLGHLRGRIILENPIEDPGDKSAIRFRLLTEGLSKGVAHFTLFSRQGEPLCERLAFIDHPGKEAALLINAPKEDIGHRSRLEVDLGMTDSNNRLLEGELSMSVYTVNNQLEVAHGTTNIKSWLLLNSDLGGTVPDPNYFFEDDSGSRKRLLDVLMLTHGWRRFIWKDLITDSIAKTQEFLPEKGIMIHGRTTSFKNSYQPLATHVKLSILGKSIYQEKGTTNIQGKFSFGPLVFQDSASVIVEAMAKDAKKPKDAAIFIDPIFRNIPFSTQKELDPGSLTTLNVVQYLKEAGQKKVTDFKYDPKVTLLDEVTVTAKKKTRQELVDEKIDQMTLYGQPSNRIFIDSIPALTTGSAIDVLRLVPGVQVTGEYPNQSVIIRGASSISFSSNPLFLLDGVPVDAQAIQNMRAVEVMFIDVLKGPAAAIYGSRSAGGVVAVYSHIGLGIPAEPQPVPGVANFKIPGFYKTREFYAPDYSTERPEHERPDYRTTLHWEPTIALDGKEKASVHFYTGDSSGEYLIQVEGMSEDGRPVTGMSRITVSGDGTKL
ncbi:MAG: TonB-dependent receptor plug domain-containing protein [Bacteroidota bacterium]